MFITNRILLEPVTVEGGGTVDEQSFFEPRPVPEHLKGETVDVDDEGLESINSPLGGPTTELGEDGLLKSAQPFKLELKDEDDEKSNKDKKSNATTTVDKNKRQTGEEEETVSTQQQTDKTKQQQQKPAATTTPDKNKQTTESDKSGLKTTFDKKAQTPAGNGQEQQTTGARDYSIFPAEVGEALKKTPNSSFNPIYKFVKETAEREAALKTEIETKYKDAITKDQLDEKGLPLNYYTHPEAYTLTPEYQEAATMAGRAEYEQAHWQQQLEKIEAGEPWNDFSGWYKQTGQPAINPKAFEDYSARAKAHVIMKLQQASMTTQQYHSHISQMAGVFQERSQRAQKFIEATVEKEFPWTKDKNAPEWQHYNTLVQKFTPPEFRGHPMTDMAGKLYAQLVNAITYINEMNVKQQQQQQVQADNNKLEESVTTTVTETPVDENGVPQQHAYGGRRITGAASTTGRNKVKGEISFAEIDD